MWQLPLKPGLVPHGSKSPSSAASLRDGAVSMVPFLAGPRCSLLNVRWPYLTPPKFPLISHYATLQKKCLGTREQAKHLPFPKKVCGGDAEAEDAQRLTMLITSFFLSFYRANNT